MNNIYKNNYLPTQHNNHANETDVVRNLINNIAISLKKIIN